MGRAFTDDAGPWHPLGVSFFWLLWGWKFDRERTEQNLAFVASHSGVDYVRMFCEVGGTTWEDRTIDPRWPDYEAVLGDAIDTAFGRYGLRVELTVLAGGSGAPRELAFQKVIKGVLPGREYKVIHGEGANEHNFGDEASFHAMLRDAIRASTILWAVNSPPVGVVEEVERLITDTGAQVATGHFDRTPGDFTADGRSWRQVRQPWDWRDLRWPGSHNEPAGPQSSVAEQNDPLVLAMMRAVGILCGVGAFVLHTGAGVRGGGAADVARGRSANFWEVPRIDEIFEALHRVASLLPADLSNWTKTNGHWRPPLPEHPLPADRVWTDGHDHGIVRTYGAFRDDQFVTLPHGVREYVVLTPPRACTVRIHNPLTAELVTEARLAAGEGLRLEGPGRGGLAAYVVLGQR